MSKKKKKAKQYKTKSPQQGKGTGLANNNYKNRMNRTEG